MNAAVSLSEILPASALTSRKDRFRCEPYRCVMPARDCLARQAKAKIPDLSHGQRMEIAKCIGCSLGAEVSARCASLEDDAGPLAHVAGSVCSVPRCTQRATSDGLCTKHLLRKYSAGRDANAGSAVVARAIAPIPPPLPAVETPAATPAPQPSIVPEDIMPPKSDSLAPSCAVLGCRALVGATLDTCKPCLRPLCPTHRKRGFDVLSKGRATPETVVAYLGEGPHPKGRKGSRPTAKSAGKQPSRKALPKACATPPTPIASDPAVELSSETISVTVRLPDDLVRASRCAATVGGIEVLEQLVTLRSDSTLMEIMAALSTLPARGER